MSNGEAGGDKVVPLMPARPLKRRDKDRNATAIAPLDTRQLAAYARTVARQHPRWREWSCKRIGVPLGETPGGPLFEDFEGHRLIIGGTGQGKGVSVITPMALHDVRDKEGRRTGMVFVDCKNGETARKTAAFRAMQCGTVYLLDPCGLTGPSLRGLCPPGQVSHHLNPLDFLNPDEPFFVEQCAALAAALIVPPDGESAGNQKYWDDTAQDLMKAMIAHLVTMPGETASLNRLVALIDANAEEFIGLLNAMRDNPNAPEFVARAANRMERIASQSPKEFSGYFSTINRALGFMDSPLVQRCVGSSDFDPALVRDHGHTIYIVTSEDYIATHAPWVRLMCETIKLRLKTSKAPRPRKVHFMIDEAAGFGRWNFITDGVRAARGANISLHLIYQGIPQLEGIWPKGWGQVTGVARLHFLGAPDPETNEWIAKLAGETDIVEVSVARGKSSNASTAKGQSTSTAIGQSRAVGSSWGVSLTLGEALTVSQGTSRNLTSTNSKGGSKAIAVSRSDTYSKSESRGDASQTGWSRSTGTSEGETHGESTSLAIGRSFSTANSTSHSSSSSYSSSVGSSSTYSSGPNGGSFSFGTSENSSSSSSSSLTTGLTTTEGSSRTETEGRSSSVSVTRSETIGQTGGRTLSRTLQDGHSRGDSRSQTDGENWSLAEGQSDGITDSESRSTNQAKARQRGRSVTVTVTTTTTTSESTTTTEGQGETLTQTQTMRRRLLTVAEVRAGLKGDASLVFTPSDCGSLMRMMDFRRNPAIQAQELEGKAWLAHTLREDD